MGYEHKVKKKNGIISSWDLLNHFKLAPSCCFTLMGWDMKPWAETNPFSPKWLLSGYFITAPAKRHDTETSRQCSDIFLLLSILSGPSGSSFDVHSIRWILWWRLNSLLQRGELHKPCLALSRGLVLAQYFSGCARGVSGCQCPSLLCWVSPTKLRSLWEAYDYGWSCPFY